MNNLKNMTGLIGVRKCQTPNWSIQHYDETGARISLRGVKHVADSRGRQYKVLPAGNLKRV